MIVLEIYPYMMSESFFSSINKPFLRQAAFNQIYILRDLGYFFLVKLIYFCLEVNNYDCYQILSL